MYFAHFNAFFVFLFSLLNFSERVLIYHVCFPFSASPYIDSYARHFEHSTDNKMVSKSLKHYKINLWSLISNFTFFRTLRCSYIFWAIPCQRSGCAPQHVIDFFHFKCSGRYMMNMKILKIWTSYSVSFSGRNDLKFVGGHRQERVAVWMMMLRGP